MKDKTLFLVRVTGGDWDDFYDNVIFPTLSEETAIKYCKKYNSILNKWKEYFKQFETSTLCGSPWVGEDQPFWVWNRWNTLKDIEKCYYKPIEMR